LGWVSCLWVKSVGSSQTSVHFTGVYLVTSQNGALFSVLVCAEFVGESVQICKDSCSVLYLTGRQGCNWVRMRRVYFRQDIADVALTSPLKLSRRLKAIKTTSVASASVLQQPDVSNISLHQQVNDRARLRNVVMLGIYAVVSPGRFHLRFMFVWDTDLTLLVADVSRHHSGISYWTVEMCERNVALYLRRYLFAIYLDCDKSCSCLSR